MNIHECSESFFRHSLDKVLCTLGTDIELLVDNLHMYLLFGVLILFAFQAVVNSFRTPFLRRCGPGTACRRKATFADPLWIEPDPNPIPASVADPLDNLPINYFFDPRFE